MSARPYIDPVGLRRALETRLKVESQRTSLPLDRIRKEPAMQRLLARVAASAAPDSWALKGGLAMIARIGEQARATADADATWRAGVAALTRILELAAELDLGDHFEFTVAAPTTMQTEGPEHGLRFAVEARLAGRLFERRRLDLSIVSDDPRPVEVVHLRNLFEFAGFGAVAVPAIRTEQQLAEKVHAYTRVYASGDNGALRASW